MAAAGRSFHAERGAMPGKSVADLESGIYAEIERVKNEPVQA
jgi:hypothetical protein